MWVVREGKLAVCDKRPWGPCHFARPRNGWGDWGFVLGLRCAHGCLTVVQTTGLAIAQRRRALGKLMGMLHVATDLELNWTPTHGISLLQPQVNIQLLSEAGIHCPTRDRLRRIATHGNRNV